MNLSTPLLNNPDSVKHSIFAVIPAFNEEDSIGQVLSDLPADLVPTVVVVNNASTDRTPERARAGGAIVVDEPTPGYGMACLTGIAEARRQGATVILFLDGDYSDHPEEASAILQPVIDGDADLVIGSRALGEREPGAMPPQALFGNWLSTFLIRLIWGVRFTDLGPFRAISVAALDRLDMQDRDYGWTVEMQAKAALLGLRSIEVPVSYRKRIGESKISGTLKGSIVAGWKILWTIATLAIARSPRSK